MTIQSNKLFIWSAIAIISLEIISYITLINIIVLKYVLYILFTTLLAYNNKQTNELKLAIISITGYLIISFGFYPLKGLDMSFFETSFLLLPLSPLIFFPKKTKGSKIYQSIVFIVTIFLCSITIYELYLLWYVKDPQLILNRALKLGFPREGLPHLGPIYIPLGLGVSNHQTSLLSFILAIFYLERKVILSIILTILGLLCFSLTNAITFFIVLLFYFMSKKQWKVIVLFIGLGLVASPLFLEFLVAKLESNNVSNFWSFTSFNNLRQNFFILIIGHATYFDSILTKTEIAILKILFEWGLLSLSIVISVFNVWRKIKSPNNKFLLLYAILSLLHYGEVIKLLPLSILYILSLLNEKDLIKSYVHKKGGGNSIYKLNTP